MIPAIAIRRGDVSVTNIKPNRRGIFATITSACTITRRHFKNKASFLGEKNIISISLCFLPTSIPASTSYYYYYLLRCKQLYASTSVDLAILDEDASTNIFSLNLHLKVMLVSSTDVKCNC